MILATIDAAILSRIKADTGAGGLYESSAWSTTILAGGAWANTGVPPTSSAVLYPHLVYTMQCEAEHGFIDEGFLATITLDVRDQLQNGMGRVSAVLDRLFGNAVLQSGRIPTYGFHRHVLALATNTYGAVGGDCLAVLVGTSMDDEHIIHGTMVLETHYSALAANP